MAKSGVPRPLKKSEFTIVFGTRACQKAWADLLATQRSAVVDAWDFLTRTPLERLAKNHPLRDDLATVTRNGRTHDQRQHELAGGARLWFYVDGREVVLVQCHTHHLNATK